MSASLYVTGAIMAAFLLAAIVWSAARVKATTGAWRLLHLGLVLLLPAAGLCVYLNLILPGIFIGLCLLLLALAALLFDGDRRRWLAFVPLFTGLLLAAGVPFVTG